MHQYIWEAIRNCSTLRESEAGFFQNKSGRWFEEIKKENSYINSFIQMEIENLIEVTNPKYVNEILAMKDMLNAITKWMHTIHWTKKVLNIKPYDQHEEYAEWKRSVYQ